MASLTPLLSFALVFLLLGLNNAKIKFGFYDYVCPNAEAIVYKEMMDIMSAAPTLAGPLVRMHYHDCFVKVIAIILHAHTNNLIHKLLHDIYCCSKIFCLRKFVCTVHPKWPRIYSSLFLILSLWVNNLYEDENINDKILAFSLSYTNIKTNEIIILPGMWWFGTAESYCKKCYRESFASKRIP